jgi:hypothetical protein
VSVRGLIWLGIIAVYVAVIWLFVEMGSRWMW